MSRLPLVLATTAVLAVASGASPAAVPARSVTVQPGEDLCAALDGLRPGDEAILAPGDHQGSCAIRHGGAPGAPITIRGQDPARPARIQDTGRRANVLELRASHVRVVGLAFGPTRPDVDAVRIYGGRDFTIERCRFTGLGGIAVAANHDSVDGLRIRDNRIERVNATALYLGCHDGRRCAVTRIVIEDNVIRDVRAPERQIGYGIQVKLNSWGVIRRNVVLDTKGPAIMVYGATDPAATSTVERNVAGRSRRASAIVVAGGPAVVRNNIALSGAGPGIALEDYGGRGLLRGVVVAHNTVYASAGGGIGLRGAARDSVIVNNAVHVTGAARPLPEPRPGLRLGGNVDCSDRPCFTRPEDMDFSPTAALAHSPVEPVEPGLVVDDFFGAPRSDRPASGAIERPNGRRPLRPPR